MKTVWQVKLLRMADIGVNVDCASANPGLTTLTAPATGLLEARAEPADTACTSWKHDQELTVSEFLERGLVVEFSQSMKQPEGRGVAWFVVTVEYDWAEFEGDPTEIFVRRLNAEEMEFDPLGTAVRFQPFPSFPEWSKQAPLPDQVLCRVVLKSHVLTNGSGEVLDGDFIGTNFPTGNGSVGGDFESWFTITQVRG